MTDHEFETVYNETETDIRECVMALKDIKRKLVKFESERLANRPSAVEEHTKLKEELSKQISENAELRREVAHLKTLLRITEETSDNYRKSAAYWNSRYFSEKGFESVCVPSSESK